MFWPLQIGSQAAYVSILLEDSIFSQGWLQPEPKKILARARDGVGEREQAVDSSDLMSRASEFELETCHRLAVRSCKSHLTSWASFSVVRWRLSRPTCQSCSEDHMRCRCGSVHLGANHWELAWSESGNSLSELPSDVKSLTIVSCHWGDTIVSCPVWGLAWSPAWS